MTTFARQVEYSFQEKDLSLDRVGARLEALICLRPVLRALSYWGFAGFSGKPTHAARPSPTSQEAGS